MKVTRSKSGPQRQKDRSAPIVKDSKHATSKVESSRGSSRTQGPSQTARIAQPSPPAGGGDTQ